MRRGVGHLGRSRGRCDRRRWASGHRARGGPGVKESCARRLPDNRCRMRELQHRPRLGPRDGRCDPHRARRRRVRRSSNRRRSGSRGGDRRLARRGRRRRRCKRRQEAQRVEVALRIAPEPDPELHVRHRVGEHSTRPDERNRLTLGHDGARVDQERAEMQQRDRVAVGRLNGDREPVRGDLAGEHDRPRGRRDHGVAESALDVDPAMLSRNERVVLVERKPLQHRPRNRPRPGAGRGGHRQGQEHRDYRDSGERRSSLPVLQTATKVPGRAGRCQIGLQRAAVQRVARGTGQPRDELGGLSSRHSRLD